MSGGTVNTPAVAVKAGPDLDRMVDPPALYVPTEGGLAVLRALP